MTTYTMPCNVLDESMFSHSINNGLITPMDDFKGDDYMSGSHYMYPTPQSLPRTNTNTINGLGLTQSPALYSTPMQNWDMLSMPMGGVYSASSSNSGGSPMTCMSMPVRQEQWQSVGYQSAFPTPASELSCFDFDTNSITGTGPEYMPRQEQGDFIDPISIHAAPPHMLISKIYPNDVAFGPAPHNHTHPHPQGSFPYYSNQYQRSRSRSPAHSPAWHRHSPNDSIRSINSASRSRTSETEEDGKPRNRCPYPDCGKLYKDLKAHMLTHQDERPEKCPITTCEFNKRGFARKYDRNRHLVTTHYKATIVCGFCPGSGTSSEKTFNRTDVFKRHLLSVHCVEQQNGSSRKKSPTSSSSSSQSAMAANGLPGRCSTCGNNFVNAQELFNHLDDCVLRVVQEINPTEANNERLLSTVRETDEDMKHTLERNKLTLNTSSYANRDGDDVEEIDRHDPRSGRGEIAYKPTSPPTLRSNVLDGRVTKPTQPVLYGQLNNTLAPISRKRKELPNSWGIPAADLNLKKRVLCVFDGTRRLWKDEMMMNQEYEVRMDLPDGQGWVNQVDVESLHRADAVANATEEERTMWTGGGLSIVTSGLAA